MRKDRKRITSRGRQVGRLRALATDAAGQLDVLGHDGDALGVNGAEVGVLKDRREVSLRRLLQRRECMGLEPQLPADEFRHLTHKALEREPADEELRRLLVTTDLTKSDRPRPVAMIVLLLNDHHSGLGSHILPRRSVVGAMGFACSLLGACHRIVFGCVFGAGILLNNHLSFDF